LAKEYKPQPTNCSRFTDKQMDIKNTGEDVRLPSLNRLQSAPLIFRGLNMGEFMSAIGISFVIALFLAIVLGLLAGEPAVAFLVLLSSFLVLFLSIGSVLQSVKYGRPDGYYRQWLSLTLQRSGLPGFYIASSGYRDLSRGGRDE